MTQLVNEKANESQVLLLATEQQVHAFELMNTPQITIGRHDTNDLRLGSRTVSNYHAEVLNEDEGLLLRDLDSTNGTFVNDQRIERWRLKEDDQIRIGNYLLTVHFKPFEDEKEGFFRYRRNPELFGVGASGNLISLRGGSDQVLKTLQTADLRDLSLPDLLKILTLNAKSVTLLVNRGPDKARVFVRKDRLVHAEYGRAQGEKALYRLFGWQRATYEVLAYPATPPVSQTITLPTDTLIMEGMQQVGELAKIVPQLPPLEVPLHLKEDCSVPLSALSSAEIEIYQCIIRHQTIALVLEETIMSDFRALRLIDALLRKGVFEVSDTSEALLEETFVFKPNKPV